jgi:carbon starvation protein
LQPRDFLNSLLLYLGLGLTYIGFFVLRPAFVAPVVDAHPTGAPPMYPFVFIVIACGAASGFHSLVSSGTTSKQLDREVHARPIGYGGMIGESVLGLAAVIACTAGFSSKVAWQSHYGDWNSIQDLGSKMSAFIEGCTRFVAALGIPLSNRYFSSTLAVAAISFFAFYKIDGKAAGLALWQLFGSTNQLLAGLALLVVSLYLIERRRPSLPYLIPMLFMMVTTLVAMSSKLRAYWQQREFVLLIVGGAIAAIAIWLVIEALIAVRRYRRSPPVDSLEIEL